MSNLIPFQFEGRHIRVVTDESGEPLFVGKDICESLGFADPTSAIKQHCKGVVKRHPLQTTGGLQELRVLGEPDVLRLIVNCTLPAADTFERLVFEEILPTIRKTGKYAVAGTLDTTLSALTPAKEFKALFGVARMIGCDKPAAAISANQAVTKMTGLNLLTLLGQTHINAENQDALYFTPTELGERSGISGRKFNQLLAEAGFQMKRGEVWEVLEAGKDFARIYDTGKRHGSGVPIQQIKWAVTVTPMLKQAEEV